MRIQQLNSLDQARHMSCIQHFRVSRSNVKLTFYGLDLRVVRTVLGRGAEKVLEHSLICCVSNSHQGGEKRKGESALRREEREE